MAHQQDYYTYAMDIKEIPISKATSGLGYYCIGCNREMKANKGQIVTTHYYSHYNPAGTPGEIKCSYKDETYRHKLGKEILQRLKRIKVPNVYKFPPEGMEGGANKIADSTFITAHTVRNEVTFFENEQGLIESTSDPYYIPKSDKFYTIKADVVFYDSEGNAILLIELVATHKVDKEKTLKIKKLGIDTIEVLIPRGSPEEIEEAFQSTTNTKWVYNNEQERRTYVPVPQRAGEELSSSDELQRKFFRAGESFGCKQAEINFLISRVRKFLASEQTGKIEHSIRSEIERVQRNIERERADLINFQRNAAGEIEEEFRDEESQFAKEQGEFLADERRMELEKINLEGRYSRKVEELEQKQRSLGRGGSSFEQLVKRIGTEETELEDLLRNKETELVDAIKREHADLQSKIEEEGRTIADIEQRIRNLPIEFGELEKGAREQFRIKEDGIGKNFEIDRERSISSIKNRDFARESRVARSIKDLLQGRELIQDCCREHKDFRRYRQAKICLDEKLWKN